MSFKSIFTVSAVFLLLELIPASAWSEGTWRPAAPMPTAVQELYAYADGDRIYVLGGVTVGAGFTDEGFVYDPGRDAWTALPRLPEGRHHVTAAVVGGKLFAIGGFRGNFPHWEARNTVFVLDLDGGKQWTAVAPLAGPRAEHVAVVIDGRIHTIGGRVPTGPGAVGYSAHVDSDLHEVFDPGTGKWSARAAAPTRRNSHAAAVIDGKIYVVGGRQNRLPKDHETSGQPGGGMEIINLPTLEVYDPKTDRWETRTPMPQGQGGLAAAALDGKLYVFGGERWTPSKLVYSEAWVYDPGTDQWSAVASLPEAKHGLTAATVGDEIYVFGGAIKTGAGAVNSHHVFRP